jgi:hypothetical protein
MTNILAMLFIALLSASCTDWLDIKPLDKMVLEDYWKTENDVESSILACYSAMASNDFMERIIASGEARSDNVIQGGSDPGGDMRNILKLTIDPDNGLAKWEIFYKIINHCNLVLKYAPEVAKIDPNYTQGKQQVHEAEALTLRALAYFYLVRIYRDVPYIRVPYVDDNENFETPQTSGEVILEDILKDLITAKEYAVLARGYEYFSSSSSSSVRSNTKGRITKNAVRALMADIYLWQASGLKDNLAAQKYEACIRECEEIESFEIVNEYEDRDDYTGAELTLIKNDVRDYSSFSYTFATGNSDESIFELQFDAQIDSKKITDMYGRIGREGNLSAAAKEEWLSDRSKDVRNKYAYAPEASNTRHIILKYVLPASVYNMYSALGMPTSPLLIGETVYPNWILYRLPDAFLMKAEALVELGGDDNLRAALDLVNKVWLRSYPDGDRLRFEQYNDQAKMRYLVLDERQREFLFEGKRWFDLIRLWRKEGPTLNVLGLMTRKYKGDTGIMRSKLSIEGALYMPVHSNELLNNTALVQNSFYKTILDNKK